MDIESEVVVDLNPPNTASTPSNPITDTAPPMEDEGAPEAPPVEEAPIPKGVQKRIDRAVRQKYEAEARARMLEERVAAMEARQYAPPPQAGKPTSDEPTIDKFDNFDEYVAAKAEYIAKKQIEATLTDREKRQAEEREATSQRQIAESWGKKVEQATAELPDFEEVISSADLPMTPLMRQAIMESDVGPKLAYYLATHPEEAVALAGMSGVGAVRTIGRIEERLAAAKPSVKVTNAPAPITPVGTRAGVKKDPGKMSDAEYEKWRRGQAA